ncbi:hypothetical protein FB45DRAFT_868989 [Roridomyces roridus]|uniref:Uncharacterized protein n=1 Tax=Roridomyces roridus TaxID=1738132 RepID=A0AAD7BMZ8_9AGAR|nr:hypothetical protein FB45DRAFT_868989 [Roridomyces roridus]
MYEQYRGSPEAKVFTAEIQQIAGNIKKLVYLGLYPENPDLKHHIKYILVYLQYFRPRYELPKIMEQVQKMLSQQPDHKLQVGYITVSFAGGTDQATQTPEILISQALECLGYLNDPGVESLLYCALGSHYCRHNDDGFTQAMAWFQKAVATAKTAGDLGAWAEALGLIANIHWRCGQYDAGKIDATEAQRLAKISGNLAAEASALGYSALCSQGLGYYNQAVSDLQRARQTLELAGPNRVYYWRTRQAEGEIYRLKSDYLKARNVFVPLTLNDVDRENQAYGALNVATIDVEIGQLGEADVDVELNIATAQEYFREVQSPLGLHLCQAVLANLQLKQHKWMQAKTMFEECLQASVLQCAELMFYALERLADTTLWNCIDLPWTSRYTVIYLVLSVRHKSRLDIHKALRCLGDVLLSENNYETAETLFQVALEGFTAMDIHRSRAECMTQMGELAMRAGRMDRAEILWRKACILFERSSQTTQATEIQRKLADLANRNKEMLLMSRGVVGGNKMFFKAAKSPNIITWVSKGGPSEG